MHTFAVVFGVFKLVQGRTTLQSCLEKLEETLEHVAGIAGDTTYIGQKVCYIESSISDGLPASFCSFSPSPLFQVRVFSVQPYSTSGQDSASGKCQDTIRHLQQHLLTFDPSSLDFPRKLCILKFYNVFLIILVVDVFKGTLQTSYALCSLT